jgi:hypothetical protein
LGNLGKNWIIYKNLGKFGLLEKNQRKLGYWINLKTWEKLHYLYKNLEKNGLLCLFFDIHRVFGLCSGIQQRITFGKKNWIREIREKLDYLRKIGEKLDY